MSPTLFPGQWQQYVTFTFRGQDYKHKIIDSKHMNGTLTLMKIIGIELTRTEEDPQREP